VTVRWPNGTVDALRGIPANRHVVIEEGSGIVAEAVEGGVHFRMLLGKSRV